MLECEVEAGATVSREIFHQQNQWNQKKKQHWQSTPNCFALLPSLRRDLRGLHERIRSNILVLPVRLGKSYFVPPIRYLWYHAYQPLRLPLPFTLLTDP